MLYFLHLFLFFLFLLFFLFSLYFTLLLFLFFFHQIISVPRISFLQKWNKVFDSFNVSFFLFLPLLFILFLHFSFYVSIWSFSCIIVVYPDKSFVGCKVFPIIIELKNSFNNCFWIAKSLIFSHFFLKILPHSKSLRLLSFNLLKNVSIDKIKASFFIPKSFIACRSKIVPDIETKAIHLCILFRHLIFVE